MVSKITEPIQWTLEKVKTEALKYNTRKEFAQNCYSAYNYARKNKLLDTVCLHMLSSMPIKKELKRTKSIRRKWTFESLQAEASKYKSRSEFCNNSKAAYSAAKQAKLLDKICSHMKFKHKSH